LLPFLGNRGLAKLHPRTGELSLHPLGVPQIVTIRAGEDWMPQAERSAAGR